MEGFWERTASSALKTNMETAGPASIVIADGKNVITDRKRLNKKAKLQGTRCLIVLIKMCFVMQTAGG